LIPDRALFFFFFFFLVCVGVDGLRVCRSVEERLRKRPFDDWTLGNSDSQLSEEGFDGKRIRGRKVGGSFDDWRLGNSDSPMEQARVREESSRMGQARVWKDVERRFDDDSRECRKDLSHACPKEISFRRGPSRVARPNLDKTSRIDLRATPAAARFALDPRDFRHLCD
jgi:hypothetical protein